jgi:hypothetical protein
MYSRIAEGRPGVRKSSAELSCTAGDIAMQNGELAQVQTVLHSIPEIHDDEKTLQVRLFGHQHFEFMCQKDGRRNGASLACSTQAPSGILGQQ